MKKRVFSMKNYTEVLIVTQSKRSLLGYLFVSKNK